MTERDFCYWLNGFAELHGLPPDPEQWAMIKEHLALVFTKVTGNGNGNGDKFEEPLPYYPLPPIHPLPQPYQEQWMPAPVYCTSTPAPGEETYTETPDDFIRHNATVGGCAGVGSAPFNVVFNGQALMDRSVVPPRVDHVDNRKDRIVDGLPRFKQNIRYC